MLYFSAKQKKALWLTDLGALFVNNPQSFPQKLCIT